MVSESALPDKILEMDIVVIGAGGSGMAAAISAVEGGADPNRILILEKNAPGGNSALAEGLFAVESPVQERLGIKINKDEMFKIAMKYSHWELNARLVRHWIDKSGDTVRWLEEMGVKFMEPILPFSFGQEHLVYHAFAEGPGPLIKTLVQNCQSKGIQILRKTAATKLLTGPDGQVVGVLAKSQEGNLSINTKSVIIATGGFAGNREMLKKFYPHYSEDLFNIGVPNMGDGIQMALEVGAGVDGLGRILGHGPAFTSGFPQTTPIWGTANEPDTLWVNKNGERFVNEDLPVAPVETMNPANRQPGKIIFSLFDERKKQSLLNDGVIKQAGIAVPAGTKPPNLDELLQSQASKGNLMISDSWEEIAKWIGAEREIFLSTINEYNLYCDRGYDEMFAKNPQYLKPLRTPPFYAIKLVPALLNTIGGIKINHEMEVLNQQDKPIRGLYAVGVDTGGWSPETYNIMLSGNALGFAINSGRIAGENVAKYVAD